MSFHGASAQVATDAARIPLGQRIELTASFRRLVDDALRAEMTTRGHGSLPPPLVTIRLEFDEKRLAADAEAQRKQQDAAIMARVAELTKPVSSQEAGKDEAGILVARSSGIRLGRLNVDLDREQAGKLLGRPYPDADKAKEVQSPAGSGVAVSIGMPELGRSARESFRFDPTDYLSKIDVSIALAASFPKDLEPAVVDTAIAVLGIAGLAGSDAKNWVKVAWLPAPPPKTPEQLAQDAGPLPGAGDWVRGLWAPNNLTLGLLMAVGMLGMFLMVATMLMGRAFKTVAQGIRELKPKESAAGDAESADAAGAAAATHAVEAGVVEQDDGRKNRHDPQAAARALTSEMRTIRDQLAEVVSESSQLFAELLGDLFYRPRGLDDIKDLLSFAGYRALRPSLDRLPGEAIRQLQAHVEDTADDPVSLLNGVEVAQRLIRDCVSRIGGAPGATSAAAEKVREAVLGISQSLAQTLAKSCSPEEVALILQIMPMNRGNSFAKLVPPETLQAAMPNLDRPLLGDGRLLEELIGKIERLGAESDKGAGSGAQLRFVLRIARHAKIPDEPALLAMIGPKELLLRREVMRTRFPYAWVGLLPDATLRAALDASPASARAELLFVAGDALAARLLGIYQDGSKLKELLVNELDLIGKNPKRRAAAESASLAIREDFMTRIRGYVAARPALCDGVLLQQCKAEGIEAPPWLAGAGAASDPGASSPSPEATAPVDTAA